MTWSYALTLATSKDVVRFLVGDTDTTDQQLADEEIAYLLTQDSDPTRAAVNAAEALAGKYARAADFAITGDVQESASQRAKSYYALADRLRKQGMRKGVTPYAGGTSLSRKAVMEENDDRVPPIFTRDMQAEPGTTDIDPNGTNTPLMT